MNDAPDSAAESVAAPRRDRPPRDMLFRSAPLVELRAADEDGDDDALPTMFGHFCVFNVWTEIKSWYEGNFLERLAPGCCKKTFREHRGSIRPLFQHGFDPYIGDKPLGPVDDLRETETGGYYEVPLIDTPYNAELLPGLRRNLYGTSFRFRVVREEFVREPGVSEHNPRGLPERTLKEIEVLEFGPVTFPAYPEATASVRSLTDEFVVMRFGGPERLRELLDRRSIDLPPAPDLRTEPTATDNPPQETAPSERDAGASPHLTDERRDTAATPRRRSSRTPLYGTRQKEKHKPWLI